MSNEPRPLLSTARYSRCRAAADRRVCEYRCRARSVLSVDQLARLPQDEWHTLLVGAHDGYISWDQHQENQARLDDVDRLRHEQVERAQYEAELAQRRYLRVDPDNRLVADTLEADWNSKLRALHEAQRLYEQERQKDRLVIDDELRIRLHLLATDFPRVWRDPATPDRERKRLVRLLLEDVTLIKRDQLLIHLRFPGGTTRTLQRPRPRRVTVRPHSIISEIDRLLDDHSYDAVASDLNAQGFVSGYGNAFTGRMIGRLTMNYGLKSRFTRLREQGMLTLDEM
jgi:hypothetical protein